MRNTIAEWVIIGVGISIVVLMARWLIADGFVIGQLVVILVGAAFLAGIQYVLSRVRSAQSSRAEPAQPQELKADSTPLHSPRTPWVAPTATHPMTRKSAPPEAPPEPQADAPGSPQGVSEPEDSQQKMV